MRIVVEMEEALEYHNWEVDLELVSLNMEVIAVAVVAVAGGEVEEETEETEELVIVLAEVAIVTRKGVFSANYSVIVAVVAAVEVKLASCSFAAAGAAEVEEHLVQH